jgi:predicted phosphodiesterase
MRIGLITDSHANPWGPEVAIKYLRDRGIEKKDTHNLGDVTGMFPEVVAAIETVRGECETSILGNHDAVLLDYFEDVSKRWERIAALEQNRERLNSEGREDLVEWLSSLQVDRIDGGVYFVHNSPFGSKDPCDRGYMLDRFGLLMKAPSDHKYNPQISKLQEVSQSLQQVIVRGHSHLPSVYRVRRGLNHVTNDIITSFRLGKGEDSLTMDMDPDFVYVITVGSACGANTMFTRDEDLDYRPMGGIIEYDEGSGRGKITLFRTDEGYSVDKFIASVKANPLWSEFTEAQRQVNHLRDYGK